MGKLIIKCVKKPVRLKDLGYCLYSFWQGRVYGSEDMVPVEDANRILQRARDKSAANS